MTTQTELVRMKHCHAMMSKMAGFRSDDKFSDINVIVDGEVYKCHQNVLSAASEYFDKMFSGPFTESSTKEVTLQGIKAKIFEGVLKFVYTGEAVIQTSNVYDMICAADFYNLPLVTELCAKFVKENLNALAEDILRIFSLAHRLKLTQLIELLCKHIHQNFCYFIRRPEFSKLTVDSLLEVLNLMDPMQPAPQDVFLEGIYVWIARQEDLSLANKEEYLDRLMKNIDFTKLSADYTRFRMGRLIKEVVPSQSIDNDNDACNVILRPPKVPIAFVSRNSEDGYSIGVSIFTIYIDGSVSTTPKYIWVYSGELGCPVNFMRTVLIDDRLYSLRYLKENGPEQVFCSCSSLSMYPSLTLTSPPCVLNEFDLCGTRNEIYVYNKNIPPVSNDTEYSGFSQEEISRGIYVYKRDVDKWFPVPCPLTRFTNACMTCNDEGILYLIGGRNSMRNVDIYDPRTQKWSAVSPTAGIYDGAACCAYSNKIYVAGGIHNTARVEMYETGHWKGLKDLRKPSTPKSQLVNWSNPRTLHQKILSFNRTLSANSRIRSLRPNALNDGAWRNLPNLFDVVKDTNLTFAELSILDMVTL